MKLQERPSNLDGITERKPVVRSVSYSSTRPTAIVSRNYLEVPLKRKREKEGKSMHT
jgi:hypothetical protein